jgi:hypothetical protein
MPVWVLGAVYRPDRSACRVVLHGVRQERIARLASLHANAEGARVTIAITA